MKRITRLFLFLLSVCFMIRIPVSCAEFLFHDDRFCGRFTTENLDAIIEEYELYDGWY